MSSEVFEKCTGECALAEKLRQKNKALFMETEKKVREEKRQNIEKAVENTFEKYIKPKMLHKDNILQESHMTDFFVQPPTMDLLKKTYPDEKIVVNKIYQKLPHFFGGRDICEKSASYMKDYLEKNYGFLKLNHSYEG